MAKSHGEEIVRIDFNVGGSELVSQIKRAGAEFINLIYSIPVSTGRASDNQIDAERYVEIATMLAVKAATA